MTHPSKGQRNGETGLRAAAFLVGTIALAVVKSVENHAGAGREGCKIEIGI
jgi:hypothetical protein